MSSMIQQDKMETERRGKTLKGVDAPLRDQMPKNLLSKARDMELGQKAAKVWHGSNSDRQEWLDRQQQYLEDWDEFIESTAEGPFEGSSTLHIPMPFTVTKTFHARMLQAIIQDDFRFNAKARREDSVVREQMISDTLRYALKDWANEFEGVIEVLDKWVWQWVSTGVGILKWRWDSKFTRFIDVVPRLDFQEEVVIDDDGNEQVVPRETLVEEEVELVKPVFDGPVLESVDVEDLVWRGGGGDPRKADVVQHRFWMTASELWTKVDQKIFDRESVKKIIDGGPQFKAGSVGAEIKQQRAVNAGFAALDTNNDLDRYEFVETYWNIDIDNSGINSQVVTWSHINSSEVIRATYLHRVSPDGKIPFFKADFFIRPGQEYGIGLAEILHPLSVELDALHNMRIDNQVITNMPFGFIRASSSIDPETIQLAPGALIPVDNPQQDIFFPNMGNKVSGLAAEEQAINVMVERMTGISDINLGVQTGTQGAARTATGARALIGESASNLNVHLGRLSRKWAKALEYLFHMLQKRIPPGLSFRVTGEDGSDYWQQIRDRNDLVGDFDFEISSNSEESNPQIKRQRANEIFQMVSNPLAIQLGIVNPGNFYEAVKNFAQSHNIKDFNRYFTQPQNHRVQLTPREEFLRVINGTIVPVQMTDDHQGYVEFFEFILSQPNVLGMYTEEQVQRAAAQAQQHEQMQAALDQLQAQAANTAQQQANAAQSQQQAPVGLNPLAGEQRGLPQLGQG